MADETGATLSTTTIWYNSYLTSPHQSVELLSIIHLNNPDYRGVDETALNLPEYPKRYFENA